MSVKTFRTSQAIRLLEQLGEHYEQERGWPRHVARWFDIDSSMISLITTGKRPAGDAFVDGAIQALGLSSTWFSDPLAANEHFTKYMANPNKRLPALKEDADSAPPAPRAARDEESALTLVIEVARDRQFNAEQFQQLAEVAEVVDHNGGTTRADVERLADIVSGKANPNRAIKTTAPNPEVQAAKLRAQAKGGMRPKGRK